MIAIISLVIILALSLIITRIATIALTHTGLSKESAKFQARSAFTGVGFTTTESEKVVNNPVRRKILLLLMLLGNAGIVTGIASLIIGFTGEQGGEQNTWLRIVILAAGITILWTLAQSNWVDRKLSGVITRFLKKHTRIDANDYANLLHLAGDYRISQIGIDKKHWLCDKSLKEVRLNDEGIIILGINRIDGTYLGAPGADTRIMENDSLTIYGRGETMNKLEKRTKTKRGDKDHKRMVKQQEKIEREEQKANGTADKK